MKRFITSYAPLLVVFAFIIWVCILFPQAWFVVYGFVFPGLLGVASILSFLGWLMESENCKGCGEHRFSTALVFCLSFPLFVLFMYLHGDRTF